MSTALASGEVQVWTVDLARGMHAPVLSPGEEVRAMRFRFPVDRRRFAARRHALRHILSGALGLAPEAVELCAGEWGKPMLASGEIAFNISHAGDHARIAVARGGPVGVDLERVKPWRESLALLPVVCTEAEQRLVASAADPAGLFARLWVWKEAVLKASGVGFSCDPRTVEALDPSRPGAFRPTWRDGDSLWRVHFISAPGAHEAALAVPPEARIVARAWPGSSHSRLIDVTS